jgi:hypothetical protein
LKVDERVQLKVQKKPKRLSYDVFIGYYICLIKHTGTTSDAEGLRGTEEALWEMSQRVMTVKFEQSDTTVLMIHEETLRSQWGERGENDGHMSTDGG